MFDRPAWIRELSNEQLAAKQKSLQAAIHDLKSNPHKTQEYHYELSRLQRNTVMICEELQARRQGNLKDAIHVMQRRL